MKTDCGYEYYDNPKPSRLLYTKITLIFWGNGYIGIYYGNYKYLSAIGLFGPNTIIQNSNYTFVTNNNFDISFPKSYYFFKNNILSFNSNNSLYKSWTLTLNTNANLNLYLTNYNESNLQLSNLNFKLIFSDASSFNPNNLITIFNRRGYNNFGPNNLIKLPYIPTSLNIQNFILQNIKNSFLTNIHTHEKNLKKIPSDSFINYGSVNLLFFHESNQNIKKTKSNSSSKTNINITSSTKKSHKSLNSRKKSKKFIKKIIFFILNLVLFIIIVKKKFFLQK